MRYATVCETGKVRKINQDAVFSASCGEAGLFVVADGMGGHSQGEKASQLIIWNMAQWWKTFHPQKYNNDFMQMMHGLRQEAERANQEIYEYYNQNAVCGSTMVLLFLWQDAYGIISAGDSRIYLYYRHRLRQLTTDEIWENRRDLTNWERQQHWEQYHGRLYNAVGIQKELQCSMVTNEQKTGMVFLLCSDGLYQYCPWQKLKKYMKKAGKAENPEPAAEALRSSVYQSPAKDNFSAILVAV